MAKYRRAAQSSGRAVGDAVLSGSRLPYLERRNGTCNLRVRVPDRLKLRVGLLEVRRFLRIYSAGTARLLAVQLIAQVQEIFRMAEAQALTKDEIRRLIDRCFQRLCAHTEAQSLL